jgi:hypothetical protein
MACRGTALLIYLLTKYSLITTLRFVNKGMRKEGKNNGSNSLYGSLLHSHIWMPYTDVVVRRSDARHSGRPSPTKPHFPNEFLNLKQKPLLFPAAFFRVGRQLVVSVIPADSYFPSSLCCRRSSAASIRMSKNVENNKDGGILPEEPELSKPRTFKDFLYDPKTGAVLGRTGGSWCKNLKCFQVTSCNVLTVQFSSSRVKRRPWQETKRSLHFANCVFRNVMYYPFQKIYLSSGCVNK